MSVSLIDGHIDREKQTMTDNEKNSATEMTDNEIIKALKVCHITCGCSECPYEKAPDDCVETLKRDALDLINRQKAEIERLHAEIERLHKEVGYWEAETKEARADIDQAVAEAVKEFAERLIDEKSYPHPNELNTRIVYVSDIQEMVGDTE